MAADRSARFVLLNHLAARLERLVATVKGRGPGDAKFAAALGVLDRADLVQVMKKTDSPTLRKVRNRIAKVHRTYLRRFDEFHTMAVAEKEQERERGGPR